FLKSLETTLITEVLSHNLNYKAFIYKTTAKQKTFEVGIYEWHEEKEPIWKKISGPFIFNTLAEAEEWARKNLPLFSGEEPDQQISEKLLSWLQEYSGDATAEFLKAGNFTVRLL